MTVARTMKARVLSLGAGIQSSAILLMSDRGMLPKLDCAIFADTGWEPQAVYEQLAFLESAVSIPVARVSCGRNLRDELERMVAGGELGRYATIPAFTYEDSGEKGKLKRQCTRDFKINPVTQYIRNEVLGVGKGERVRRGVLVDHWYGISSDEAHRARLAEHHWERFCYPLLNTPDDWLPRSWSRLMCQQWLEQAYPQRKWTRSACIGCPYRNNASWRQLKAAPADWQQAIAADKLIREPAKMRGRVFLHKGRVPLDRADLEEDQMEMWGEECAGVCGV